MKFKKHFNYKSSHQIWRIIISSSDKLILETRDITTKEVYYHCFDLMSKKEILKNFQPEEKHWIGIDAVYRDIIFFHRFPKPDMPGHKEIIAFDINTKKILWNNEELSFLFAYKEQVYGFKQGFDERYFYELNIKTGELIEELGSDYQLLQTKRDESEKEKNWNDYLYPEIYQSGNERIDGVIKKFTAGLEITGDIEYKLFNDVLLFNFHINENNNLYSNTFYAVDLDSDKVKIKDILNSKAQSMFKDAFFIYKNFLFLLKEKNEIIIFNME